MLNQCVVIRLVFGGLINDLKIKKTKLEKMMITNRNIKNLMITSLKIEKLKRRGKRGEIHAI